MRLCVDIGHTSNLHGIFFYIRPQIMAKIMNQLSCQVDWIESFNCIVVRKRRLYPNGKCIVLKIRNRMHLYCTCNLCGAIKIILSHFFFYLGARQFTLQLVWSTVLQKQAIKNTRISIVNFSF